MEIQQIQHEGHENFSIFSSGLVNDLKNNKPFFYNINHNLKNKNEILHDIVNSSNTLTKASPLQKHGGNVLFILIFYSDNNGFKTWCKIHSSMLLVLN